MSESEDRQRKDPPDTHDSQPRAFRFKGGAKGVGDDGEEDGRYHDSRSSRKRHRPHRSSHHRSKRSKTSHLGDDPAQYSDSMRNLGPDRAFQESLFDALGDDEGAAFWEGVYGQPIHNYPKTYIDEETGELEHMGDEEYAQYVRRKMWEKSREGIEAAREKKRRDEAREKAKTREQDAEPKEPNEDASNFIFDFEIEASLRRSQRRKGRKRWQQLWNDYIHRWEELQTLAKDSNRTIDTGNLFLRNKIAWPVESGKRKDVKTEEIERFIKEGTDSIQSEDQSTENALLSALKLERVRWHPDKMQQRYGFMQIDETTMKGVTATFQVFDRMWNELRGTRKA
jgi:hypothetical protein